MRKQETSLLVSPGRFTSRRRTDPAAAHPKDIRSIMRTSRLRLRIKLRPWFSGALAGLGLSLSFFGPGRAVAQTTPTEQVAALAPGLQAKLGPEMRAFLADRERTPGSLASLGIDGLA